MIFDQSLLDALEAIEPQSWEGELWRVVFGDRNPLFANRSGARWNPPETGALYTSLDRKTVLAELDHLRSLQTPPTRRSAYRVHRIRVRVERMVDLRDRSRLDSVGLEQGELASEELQACQQIGGAAAWLDRDAILVPSARGPGDNLVVFVDKQDPDAVLEVLESEDIEE
jgi:RES domain-containing protein